MWFKNALKGQKLLALSLQMKAAKRSGAAKMQT